METTMHAAKRIEAEFDEPLLDVISGFAKMGYSTSLVAEALEVTTPSLRHFARKRHIHFSRTPAVHRNSPGRPPRRIRHGNRVQSLTEWAADQGVSVVCIHKRLRTHARPTR